jgi:phospholipid/cholesterol/gamma-HCH transport system permease protein
MKPMPPEPAALAQTSPELLTLAGSWTAQGMGALARLIDPLRLPAGVTAVVDASAVQALDTAGAWLLQRLLQGLRAEGGTVTVQGLRPALVKLLEVVEKQFTEPVLYPLAATGPPPSALQRLGRRSIAVLEEAVALLSFVGECAGALAGCVRHPSRWRGRPVLFNLRSAGFDALPIVGLLSFLLGVVVAYQGAAQLRQYGANIFVADLIGVSMLREFAPLITAIIIAGRSGSAYAAQIGTMVVTEEIDAMRTLGIAPLELLVLPKVLALVVALPLLTAFADLMGVLGGMLMARAQLAVNSAEFLDRFAKAVSLDTYLVGLGKAPVFALVIAVVGCFQGFRTKGGADSVGRQTTRSVVQSIFLVIVADALFSVAFSALGL